MADESATRPQWMDDAFLKTCIRNSKDIPSDSNIQIKDLALTYVVPKGENYMSLMLRAIVEYKVGESQSAQTSFVVKAVHEDEEMRKMVLPMFDREALMYTELVPQLREMLLAKDIDTQITCRYIHGFEDPRVLVLDDLKPLGYSLADRHNGLDLEHVKVTYKKMAKLHAAAMVYFSEQTEETKEKFRSPNTTMQNDEKRIEMGRKLISKRLDLNLKELRQHNQKYDKAIESLTKFSKNVDVSHLAVSYKPGNKFNTLVHADCWVNNIMYKHNDEGSVEDILFVDLQLCHYSSIAIDFHYLFFSSTANEVKKHHYHELKKFYFNSLVSDLKTLEYKEEIPTFQEFEEELKRCTLVTIFLLHIMIPIILQKLDVKSKSREETKTFNLDDILAIASSPSGDAYTETMVVCVDVLQEDGYFDNFP